MCFWQGYHQHKIEQERYKSGKKAFCARGELKVNTRVIANYSFIVETKNKKQNCSVNFSQRTYFSWKTRNNSIGNLSMLEKMLSSFPVQNNNDDEIRKKI